MRSGILPRAIQGRQESDLLTAIMHVSTVTGEACKKCALAMLSTPNHYLYSFHVQRLAGAVVKDPGQGGLAICVVHIKLLQVLTRSQSPAEHPTEWEDIQTKPANEACSSA